MKEIVATILILLSCWLIIHAGDAGGRELQRARMVDAAFGVAR